MIKWLLANGSDPDERDNDGYSAMLLAACGGHVSIVEYFLSMGALLTDRNLNGDTPLLLSAYCGHFNLTSWLLEHGCSLDERNNSGMGPLMSAANGGHLEVVKLLVQFMGGDDIDQRNHIGYSPFLLACQRGHLEIVQYLAVHGADIHAITTHSHNNALALAAEHQHVLHYLTAIWNFNQLQLAVEARSIDRIHALLQAGFETDGHHPSITELACTVLPYHRAKPVCQATLQLVRRASLPWSLSTHDLFSFEFQSCIESVDWLRQAIAVQRHLPVLPLEIWLHIMTFVSRSWFAPKHSQAITFHPILKRSRSFWRQQSLLPMLRRDSCTEDGCTHEEHEHSLGLCGLANAHPNSDSLLYSRTKSGNELEAALLRQSVRLA
jgi:hypothetical protein